MLNRNPSEDDRALRLLRRARGFRGLDTEQVRRIAARLEAPTSSNRRRGLVPVLAALALLLFGGTALAWATGTLGRLPIVRTLLASHAVRPPAPPASPTVRLASATSRWATGEGTIAGGREEPEAPVPSILPAPPVPAGRRRTSLGPSVSHAERSGSVAAAPPPRVSVSAQAGAGTVADSPIAREGQSFGNVLGRWRRDHDGRAALAALDVHDRSFPAGQMALESRLLRVEILLSERRDRDALGILDAMPLGKMDVPRERELLTARGELRIKAGRCDDGRADLDAAAGGSAALADRARNALTHCR